MFVIKPLRRSTGLIDLIVRPQADVFFLGSVVTSALSRFFVRFVLGESGFRRQ